MSDVTRDELRVVVIYESMRGHTKAAAELIGGVASNAGAIVEVMPTTAVDLNAVAAADVVFVGSWTDGLFFFGQKPGDLFRLKKLPRMDRKRVGVFCTYAVNPGGTVDKLADLLSEEKGARVVARQAFNRDRVDADVVDFVAKAFKSVDRDRAAS